MLEPPLDGCLALSPPATRGGGTRPSARSSCLSRRARFQVNFQVRRLPQVANFLNNPHMSTTEQPELLTVQRASRLPRIGMRTAYLYVTGGVSGREGRRTVAHPPCGARAATRHTGRQPGPINDGGPGARPAGEEVNPLGKYARPARQLRRSVATRSRRQAGRRRHRPRRTGQAASTTTSPTRSSPSSATSDGKIAWHAFHSVGRNELAKQRPVVGDRIGIAYHGKPEGKNYESYRVIVERADGEPKTIDWDKHAARRRDRRPGDRRRRRGRGRGRTMTSRSATRRVRLTKPALRELRSLLHQLLVAQCRARPRRRAVRQRPVVVRLGRVDKPERGEPILSSYRDENKRDAA